MKVLQSVCPSLLFLFLLSLVLGCGSGKTAPAEVSGKVTYNGGPVTGGTVVFHTDKGVYPANITAEGNYTAVDLPDGEAVVTIDTELLNPNRKKITYDATTAKASGGNVAAQYAAAKGGGAPPAMPAPPKGAGKYESSPAGEGSPQGEVGKYVKIPAHYNDKAKSTLKVTLKAGSQHLDFELKD
jgi:hypothetical protein